MNLNNQINMDSKGIIFDATLSGTVSSNTFHSYRRDATFKSIQTAIGTTNFIGEVLKPNLYSFSSIKHNTTNFNEANLLDKEIVEKKDSNKINKGSSKASVISLCIAWILSGFNDEIKHKIITYMIENGPSYVHYLFNAFFQHIKP